MKNVNKSGIKIVKRKNIDEIKIVPVKSAKVEGDARLAMVNIVSDWISEQRENHQAEKVFSDTNLSNWKHLSETIEETIG